MKQKQLHGLRLDPEVFRRIKVLAAQQGKPIGDVLQDLLDGTTIFPGREPGGDTMAQFKIPDQLHEQLSLRMRRAFEGREIGLVRAWSEAQANEALRASVIGEKSPLTGLSQALFGFDATGLPLQQVLAMDDAFLREKLRGFDKEIVQVCLSSLGGPIGEIIPIKTNTKLDEQARHDQLLNLMKLPVQRLDGNLKPILDTALESLRKAEELAAYVLNPVSGLAETEQALASELVAESRRGEIRQHFFSIEPSARGMFIHAAGARGDLLSLDAIRNDPLGRINGDERLQLDEAVLKIMTEGEGVGFILDNLRDARTLVKSLGMRFDAVKYCIMVGIRKKGVEMYQTGGQRWAADAERHILDSQRRIITLG